MARTTAWNSFASAATGNSGDPAATARQIKTPAVLMLTGANDQQADPKQIPQCAMRLAGIEGVSRVYSVSGEWDLVALIEVSDYDAVAHIVTEGFPEIPGLRQTQTLTAFRAYSRKDLEQAWDIGVE